MPTLQFSTTVHCPIEKAFALLADLKNYTRWLPTSGLYATTTQISDDPIRLGTTYLDQGRSSTLPGSVTEFEPPTRLAFEEGSGPIKVRIAYRLESGPDGTRITRESTTSTRGLLRLLQPILMRPIRAENERIMSRLKAYLEAN